MTEMDGQQPLPDGFLVCMILLLVHTVQITIVYRTMASIMRTKQTAPWYRVMRARVLRLVACCLVSSATPRRACGPRQPYHLIAVWRDVDKVQECKTFSNCESGSHKPQLFIISCSNGNNTISTTSKPALLKRTVKLYE